MSDQQTNVPSTRTLRDKVLRCITNQPGMIVYRDQIVDETGFTTDQVMGVMSRLMSTDNVIVNDIDVVVQGRAWRYIPSGRVRRAVQAVTGSRTVPGEPEKPLPLTQSIRRYFKQNPGRVMYLEELQEMLSTNDNPLDERKVQVGIANAKANNVEFKECLSTVVPSRAWIYTPPPTNNTNAVKPTATTVPTDTTSTAPRSSSTLTVEPALPSPTATTSAEPDVVISSANDGSILILEEVARYGDGSKLVRDEEKTLYRLTKM